MSAAMNIIEQLNKEQVVKLSEGKTFPEFQPGDTVIDVGAGTGLSYQLLLDADRQLSRMPDLAIGQFFCLTEGHEAACRCVSLSLELTPLGSQRRPSSPEGDRTHHQQDYQQNCRPPVHGSQKKGAPGFSGRPTSEETKNKTSAAVNNPR
jgi:hypothetical protein